MSDWHAAWEEGRLGFHKDEVHPNLIDYENEFLGANNLRILVPLCGKTIDMVWLAERGHRVCGIELVEKAARDFFAEQDIEAARSEEGTAIWYRSEKIDIVVGDIFELGPEDIGLVDRIWDRAALVALPPQVRAAYTQKLLSFCSRDAMLLQNSFEYDSSKMEGPPFSITRDEFLSHYGHLRHRALSEVDEIDKTPMFREKGLTSWIVRSDLVSV